MGSVRNLGEWACVSQHLKRPPTGCDQNGILTSGQFVWLFFLQKRKRSVSSLLLNIQDLIYLKSIVRQSFPGFCWCLIL